MDSSTATSSSCASLSITWQENEKPCFLFLLWFGVEEAKLLAAIKLNNNNVEELRAEQRV